MFIIHMPVGFKVGDTAACKINREPAQLPWRSPDILVIGATDARRIVKTFIDGELRCFVCGDADGSDYDVEEVPGAGFLVFKPKGAAA